MSKITKKAKITFVVLASTSLLFLVGFTNAEESTDQVGNLRVVTEKATGNTALEAQVICPSGMTATGGGGELLKAGNNSFLSISKPVLDGSGRPIGWYVKEYTITQPFPHEIVVHCVCAKRK